MSKEITEDDVRSVNKSNLVQKWNKLVDSALKREENWRKTAKETVTIFECDKPNEIPYNVLYANVQLLSPSVYNNPPKPIVKRKYNDRDIKAKMSSEVVRRLLTYFIDDGDPTYATVDSLMSSAVMEGLVPGRGCTRVKYDAEIDDDGDEPSVKYETVCGEEIPWDRLVCGYAKKWCEVPWIGIIHYKTKDEVEKLIDNIDAREDILDKIEFTYEDEALKKEDYNTNEMDGIKLARIYEIWDKASRKRYFIAGGYDEAPIKELDDDLKLTGFYPIPEPIRFFKRISGLTPQVLYMTYKNQANELNRVTRRINAIIEAIRVRGGYDASIEGIQSIIEAEDNVLKPLRGLVNLEGRKLSDSIWMMPLNELVGVLQQLYTNREQIKSVIFEISGIADIMRGSTAASETLGAQNLKSQWGSMRLREMQKEAARYCRDYLRLMAELGITQLSQNTIMSITNLQYPTNEQRGVAQQKLMMLQHQKGMLEQQVQIQQLPPEQVQQQLQEIDGQISQLQEQIEIPTWEEILELLRNDLLRNYRIDIETNSTIEVDSAEDKKDVSEFMNGFSQLMNGFAPLVADGTLPFDAAKAMMLAVTRKYKFGEEVEDQLEKMQAPQPKQDPAQEALAQKTQLENQKIQQDLQYKQQEQQMKQQAAQMDLQVKQEQLNLDRQRSQQDAIVAEQEHNARMIELARKSDIDTAKFNQNMRKIQLTAAVDEAKAQQAVDRSSENASI